MNNRIILSLFFSVTLCLGLNAQVDDVPCYSYFMKMGKDSLRTGNYPAAMNTFYLAKGCWDIPSNGDQTNDYLRKTAKIWTDSLVNQSRREESLRKDAVLQMEIALEEEQKAIEANNGKLRILTLLRSYLLIDSSKLYYQNHEWKRSLDSAFQSIQMLHHFNTVLYPGLQLGAYGIEKIDLPALHVTNFGNAVFGLRHERGEAINGEKLFRFERDRVGKSFLSISRDRKIFIWNSGGHLLDSLLYVDGHILHAAFSDNGLDILVCTKNHLGIVKTIGGDTIQLRGHTAAVVQGVFYANDTKILTIDRAGEVIRWDRKGNILSRAQLGVPLLSIDLSQKREQAVLRSAYNLYVLNLRNDKADPRPLTDFNQYISRFVFSPEQGRLFATDYYQNKAIIQNVENNSFDYFTEVTALAVHPDAVMAEFLVGTRNGEIRVANYRTRDNNSTIKRARGKVERLVYSPDGKSTVALCQDSTFIFIRSDGKTMKHKGAIQQVVFSSDSRFLLTRTVTGQAQLWSLGTLNINGLRFSHFGDLIMDLDIGEPVLNAYFNADNSRVVGLTTKGTFFTVPTPDTELNKMMN